MVCASVFAQKKGECYFAVGSSFSAGNTTSVAFNGTKTATETVPMQTIVNPGVEFGVFVKDNVRLGFAIQVPFVKTPTELVGTYRLNDSVVDVAFNPNLAYYGKITDNFYYTPEIGGMYCMGKFSSEVAISKFIKYNNDGWSVYFNFIAFEARISKSFALGMTIGGIQYSSMTVRDSESDSYMSDNALAFNLGNGGLALRFYL